MRHVLQTGCLVAGILCFFYFAAIVLHVGMSEWFMCIWAVTGAVFLLIWRCLVYQEAHPGSVLRFVAGAGGLVLLVGFVSAAVIGSRIVGAMASKPQEGLDYVLVLGAHVIGTQPSRALQKRLDRALEYAEENRDTVFILSGGQGADEDISEADCMYRYLTEKGMAPQRLLLEDRSTSTLENLRFSAKLLSREEDRIGILSNNFHIYRALLLAEREGYRHVCGIPAHSDLWMQPHYVLREICAVLVLTVKK